MPGCGFSSGTPKSVLDALAFSGDWFKIRDMPFLLNLGTDTRLPATEYGRCVPPTQPSSFMSPISCSCFSLYLLTLGSEPFFVSNRHCFPCSLQPSYIPGYAFCNWCMHHKSHSFVFQKHVKLSCLWKIFFPKAFAMTDITYSFVPVKPKWQRWRKACIHTTILHQKLSLEICSNSTLD